MKWRSSSGDVGIYLVEICRICRSEKWNTKRATRLWPFWWSETFHFWGSPHDVGLVKSRTPPNYGCSQRENDDKPLEFGAVFFCWDNTYGLKQRLAVEIPWRLLILESHQKPSGMDFTRSYAPCPLTNQKITMNHWILERHIFWDKPIEQTTTAWMCCTVPRINSGQTNWLSDWK